MRVRQAAMPFQCSTSEGFEITTKGKRNAPKAKGTQQRKKERKMKKLMKSVMIVAGLGAMLSFAGCGAKTPDKVALDFMQTFAAGKADADYLKKNCTEDTAKLVVMFGAEAAKEMKGATFSVVETKIDGDKAKVVLKRTGGKMPSDTAPVDLVKVDGQWKVAVNKENKN